MIRRSAGFTLLEVIVTLAILSLVLVMLTEGVRAGVLALGGYERATRVQSDVVPVERTLRRMIESMDPGTYPDPPSIRGSDSALAFTTQLPDGSGNILTADVRLQVGGGRLLLLWTPHTRAVPFHAGPALHREILLERVARLELSFSPRGAARGGPGPWQTGWTQPALPGLVRLRLVLDEEGDDWPPIIARPLREPAEQ